MIYIYNSSRGQINYILVIVMVRYIYTTIEIKNDRCKYRNKPLSTQLKILHIHWRSSFYKLDLYTLLQIYEQRYPFVGKKKKPIVLAMCNHLTKELCFYFVPSLTFYEMGGSWIHWIYNVWIEYDNNNLSLEIIIDAKTDDEPFLHPTTSQPKLSFFPFQYSIVIHRAL